MKIIFKLAYSIWQLKNKLFTYEKSSSKIFPMWNKSKMFEMWFLVTDRKIEFKDLRKAYITSLSIRLGKNTKLFTGHGDDQVLKDSYIAEEFIAGNLANFSVFGEDKIIKFENSGSSLKPVEQDLLRK